MFTRELARMHQLYIGQNLEIQATLGTLLHLIQISDQSS